MPLRRGHVGTMAAAGAIDNTEIAKNAEAFALPRDYQSSQTSAKQANNYPNDDLID